MTFACEGFVTLLTKILISAFASSGAITFITEKASNTAVGSGVVTTIFSSEARNIQLGLKFPLPYQV